MGNTVKPEIKTHHAAGQASCRFGFGLSKFVGITRSDRQSGSKLFAHDQFFHQIVKSSRRIRQFFYSCPQTTPNLTIEKSGCIIKCKTSPSMHVDTNSTSYSFSKGIRKVTNSIFNNNIVVHTIDNNSKCKCSPPVPAWVKNMLNEIFVLQKSCMLGSTSIIRFKFYQIE